MMFTERERGRGSNIYFISYLVREGMENEGGVVEGLINGALKPIGQ